ncbi:Protein POOR HOMOLOGOUS SYNAPSIS 1 [Frankliniella fusca]|uniref:Protein POOR HOMOLOGOUS SYNAPSIS 1 n=1 Tax=Frankliniella fusca TaxID=407009 RepID=A0AAE1I0X0_9NEOP|nr:Protein POOR HOMOLOGOUS SYNAPSIS 1 [Frankliniella fusca]
MHIKTNANPTVVLKKSTSSICFDRSPIVGAQVFYGIFVTFNDLFEIHKKWTVRFLTICKRTIVYVVQLNIITRVLTVNSFLY